MRKITISTLLTLLYLAGTAQALRAQQTTEDASSRPTASDRNARSQSMKCASSAV